jgi:hypothetical protein
MGPFLQVLSGIFIGVFIGIFVVALRQASSKQISCKDSEQRSKKDEEAMEALDPFLNVTRVKDCRNL